MCLTDVLGLVGCEANGLCAWDSDKHRGVREDQTGVCVEVVKQQQQQQQSRQSQQETTGEAMGTIFLN